MPRGPASRLDVVMPAYNARATIIESLRSALSSPLCRRVLVIDDGSSDGTADMVAPLARQAGGRVALTRLPENGGPAYARNVGLALSDAEIIAFLDADDVYEDQALYTAATALDGLRDLALVRLALRPVGLDEAFRNHPGFDAAWRRMMFTSASNVVARREVLLAAGGFPEDELFRRHGGEDVALLQAIARTCRLGTLFTEPGVLYRIRPDCAALRLLRSCLFDITPPGVAEDLPKAEAVTRRIIQRLKLLTPFAALQPVVMEVLVNWEPA